MDHLGKLFAFEIFGPGVPSVGQLGPTRNFSITKHIDIVWSRGVSFSPVESVSFQGSQFMSRGVSFNLGSYFKSRGINYSSGESSIVKGSQI